MFHSCRGAAAFCFPRVHLLLCIFRDLASLGEESPVYVHHSLLFLLPRGPCVRRMMPRGTSLCFSKMMMTSATFWMDLAVLISRQFFAHQNNRLVCACAQTTSLGVWSFCLAARARAVGESTSILVLGDVASILSVPKPQSYQMYRTCLYIICVFRELIHTYRFVGFLGQFSPAGSRSTGGSDDRASLCLSALQILRRGARPIIRCNAAPYKVDLAWLCG